MKCRRKDLVTGQTQKYICAENTKSVDKTVEIKSNTDKKLLIVGLNRSQIQLYDSPLQIMRL